MSQPRWWVTGEEDQIAPRPIEHEPVVAWRGWHVVADPGGGHRLVSLWLNAFWPTRERIESACEEHGSIPERGHDCGIHAFKTLDAALAYVGAKVPYVGYPFLRPVEGRVCIAVGRVSLWGRVVEHEGGYRAQYAYPYAIHLIDGTQPIARDLANRYAVDVTVDGLPAPA